MYKVTVTRTQMEMQPASQSYERVVSHEEIEAAKEAGKDIETYGYVTKPAHEKKVTKTVFEQTSEEIDILGLIAAVNNVEFK